MFIEIVLKVTQTDEIRFGTTDPARQSKNKVNGVRARVRYARVVLD